MGKKSHEQQPKAPEPSKETELLADLQRLQADFENYRKRIDRDKEQHQKLAIQSLLQEILPVLDSLGLALEHAHSDPKGLAQGVGMIHEQLWHTLSAHGLEEIDTTVPFDPQKHEAIGIEHDPSKQDGTIIQTVRKGYTLAGKVMQPARVRIVKNNPTTA